MRRQEVKLPREKQDEALKTLKQKLQQGKPKTLESLTADLLSKLIEVRFTVARSGSQNGSDAGTGGRGGRHLRLECKRYADTSPLDDRNLQGEIDDALRVDAALEAWILTSTRGVPQQTEDVLLAKAKATGVPIVVIDWRDDSVEFPTLAGLCAWAPEIVEKHYGVAASTAARSLATNAEPVVKRFARELSPWAIGYQQLHDCASARLKRVWTDAAESRSAFGQNVAGGSVPTIPRHSVSSGLTEWSNSSSSNIAVIHGIEGMGKTWAVVQWAHESSVRLPIFLMLPSSSFRAMKGVTHSTVTDFIGDALHDLNPGTEKAYWRARLGRLLQRPLEEGPAILLLIDGLNEEPSFEWERFIQVLEGSIFSGRIRLVLTTQSHYLTERLDDLRRLSYRASRIEIGPYDLSKGGEFDSLLALHGLDRLRLSEQVIELARIPRFFPLVLKNDGDAAFMGETTPGRLLWAHARDVLALRAKVSLSANDWEEWLQSIAARYLQDVVQEASPGSNEKGYSLRDLGEMVRDPSGSPDETARRLQDIVSGTWLESIPGRPGRLRPKESTIHLALGVAILGSLEVAEKTSADEAAKVLEQYLDPVRATSFAASILAFALSVLVENRRTQESVVPFLIVSALLRSQNASDEQRQHAVRLAPAIVGPLLKVVEESKGKANASARHWALTALQGVSPINTSAWEVIYDRLVHWVARAACPMPQKSDSDAEIKHESKLLRDKIGTDAPGVHKVLGVPIRLHASERDDLADYVPQLLLGKPLLPALKVFVAATVAAAVTYPSSLWSGLKWLVTLNPVDRAQLQSSLDELSTTALHLEREHGVNASLALRVSALLLWLSVDETLEQRANKLRSSGDLEYGSHYLNDPVKSLFAIEHRHLSLLWTSTENSLVSKLQRAKSFFPDPSLDVPSAMAREVHDLVHSLDVTALTSSRNYSRQDSDLDSYLLPASRVSPESVEDLVSRWFETFEDRVDERRHWAALAVPRFALLAGDKEVHSIRNMRLRRPTSPHRDERIALLCLLEGELLRSPVDEQLDALVSEHESFISISLAETLRAPENDTVSSFVHRWGLENARAVAVLCNFLCVHPHPLEAGIFHRLSVHALNKESENQTIAVMALTLCNPEELGNILMNARWSFLESDREYLQDHASKAVLAASSARTLTEVSSIVAPWCLLDEAVRRGGRAADLELAIQAIDKTLRWDGLTTYPSGANISVEAKGSRSTVSVRPNPQDFDDEGGLSAFDPEARLARREAARETGHAYLRNAKAAGAVMATRVVSLEAAQMLLKCSSVTLAKWLDDIDDPKPELISRINFAGGLFLALCEALLASEPARGKKFWFILMTHLRINFTGVGGVDERLLMLFRAPENDAVLELRDHVYGLHQNANDEAYQELVLAALSLNGRTWLEKKIASDEISSEPFRRRRAILLHGFLPPAPNYQLKWHEGECIGSWDSLRMRSQKMRNRAFLARHWWKEYLLAGDSLTAFCAWQIFLSCADKMSWLWIESDIDHYAQEGEMWRLKMLHMRFNRSALDAAIKDRISKGSTPIVDRLVDWKSPYSWFDPQSLSLLNY